MEFFDKLGKKASEAYKVTADKTGKLAKEAKLRLKIGDLKSQINDIYEEIGKKVYQNHVDKTTIDLEKELEEECERIDIISNEIEVKLKECLDLRDRKQCPKCFTEMPKDVKFCPECGAKQDISEAKDVEIIDDEKQEISNENSQNQEKEENKETENYENNQNKEDSEDSEENFLNKNNNEEQNNESNTETKTSEQNEEEIENHKENLQKTVEIESNVDNKLNIEKEEVEELDADDGYEYYANDEDENNEEDQKE